MRIFNYRIGRRKFEKNISYFWNKQKYNYKILGTCSDWPEWFLRRPPIGRISLVIKYFWVLFCLMDINRKSLSNFLPIFVICHLPPSALKHLNLSVAQNMWHHYKNEKNEIHQRGEKYGKKLLFKFLFQFFFILMKYEKWGSYVPKHVLYVSNFFFLTFSISLASI